MPAKKPRRTAERILEVTLDLFNRFGEPNVSTTLISAELNISPGNLYYHYPAKDELINSLFDRYEATLSQLLHAAEDVRNVEDAGFAPKRRNMHYDILGDPFCRERDVPRMLELATAREAGEQSIPAELANYPARSRTGKQLRVIPN